MCEKVNVLGAAKGTSLLVLCVCVCYTECAHLPLTDLLEHMKKMMESRHTKDWAAASYTHILLNYILPKSHHSLHITASQWEGKLSTVDFRMVVSEQQLSL